MGLRSRTPLEAHAQWSSPARRDARSLRRLPLWRSPDAGPCFAPIDMARTPKLRVTVEFIELGLGQGLRRAQERLDLGIGLLVRKESEYRHAEEAGQRVEILERRLV